MAIFRARPGNIMLLALVGVLALTMVVGSVQLLLRERVRQSSEASSIALAQAQAGYLAEMGINAVMFEANLEPGGPPAFATAQLYDFKPQVAMVRQDPAGIATCRVGPAVGKPAPYEAAATLVTRAGRFEQVIYFDVARATPAPGKAPRWVLRRYVLPDPEVSHAP